MRVTRYLQPISLLRPASRYVVSSCFFAAPQCAVSTPRVPVSKSALSRRILHARCECDYPFLQTSFTPWPRHMIPLRHCGALCQLSGIIGKILLFRTLVAISLLTLEHAKGPPWLQLRKCPLPQEYFAGREELAGRTLECWNQLVQMHVNSAPKTVQSQARKIFQKQRGRRRSGPHLAAEISCRKNPVGLLSLTPCGNHIHRRICLLHTCGQTVTFTKAMLNL